MPQCLKNVYAQLSNSKTVQEMKFPIKDSFSKCNQIGSFLRIWSQLLNQRNHQSIILMIELSEYREFVKRSSPNFASNIEQILSDLHAFFISKTIFQLSLSVA